jgi:hypothetical protein
MGKSPRKWFGSESVDSLSRTLPGPGSYSLKPAIGNGPKYGMRPKTAYIKLEQKPGPGQYDIAGKAKPAPKRL